jgi:hypothetical protein
MMNRNILASTTVLILMAVSAFTASAQVRTKETRVTVDSLKGDTSYTKSVIISESEDITPRHSMIVINPLKFFLFYNINYIHKFSPTLAAGGGFQVPTLSGVDGFGVNAEVRIHPSGKALRGFYVAPNASYNHLTSGSAESSPFSIGILIGWQWFPGDEFAMGLGLGVDYYTGSVSNDNDNFADYNGTAPMVRFDIGYAW